MKATTEMILKELVTRYPALGVVKNDVRAAYEALYASLAQGGRVYLCGNGGSGAHQYLDEPRQRSGMVRGQGSAA